MPLDPTSSVIVQGAPSEWDNAQPLPTPSIDEMKYATQVANKNDLADTSPQVQMPALVGRGVPYQAPSMSDITTPAAALAEMLYGAGKGAVAGTFGVPGDINSLLQEYVQPKLPQQVQNVLQSLPAPNTSNQIVNQMPTTGSQTENAATWLGQNVLAPMVGPETIGATKDLPIGLAIKDVGDVPSYNFDALKTEILKKPQTVHHTTDIEPRISDANTRWIPNSLSANEKSPNYVWGSKAYKIEIPAGAKVGKLNNVFDVLPEGVSDTPKNIGRAIHDYAKQNNLDAVRVKNVQGSGGDPEWSIFNENYLKPPSDPRAAFKEAAPVLARAAGERILAGKSLIPGVPSELVNPQILSAIKGGTPSILKNTTEELASKARNEHPGANIEFATTKNGIVKGEDHTIPSSSLQLEPNGTALHTHGYDERDLPSISDFEEWSKHPAQKYYGVVKPHSNGVTHSSVIIEPKQEWSIPTKNQLGVIQKELYKQDPELVNRLDKGDYDAAIWKHLLDQANEGKIDLHLHNVEAPYELDNRDQSGLFTSDFLKSLSEKSAKSLADRDEKIKNQISNLETGLHPIQKAANALGTKTENIEKFISLPEIEVDVSNDALYHNTAEHIRYLKREGKLEGYETPSELANLIRTSPNSFTIKGWGNPFKGRDKFGGQYKVADKNRFEAADLIAKHGYKELPHNMSNQGVKQVIGDMFDYELNKDHGKYNYRYKFKPEEISTLNKIIGRVYDEHNPITNMDEFKHALDMEALKVRNQIKLLEDKSIVSGEKFPDYDSLFNLPEYNSLSRAEDFLKGVRSRLDYYEQTSKLNPDHTPYPYTKGMHRIEKPEGHKNGGRIRKMADGGQLTPDQMREALLQSNRDAIAKAQANAPEQPRTLEQRMRDQGLLPPEGYKNGGRIENTPKIDEMRLALLRNK